MVLSNVEIHRALDARRLIIEPEPPRFPGPGQPRSYDTHAVDLRLGPKLLILQSGPFCFDLTQRNFPEFLERNSAAVTIESDRPFVLEPNRFVLGITLERIALPIDVAVNLETNTCLAARIEGKSSRARTGLLVHFTAPTVHPGWDGPLVLIERGDLHEIRNTGQEPLRTLNVYVPPAYTDEGDELPAGKK